LIPGRAHLGFQHWKNDQQGRWVLRRCIGGKYAVETIGIADDRNPADGVHVLSYEQADAKARHLAGAPTAKVQDLTVRQAMDRYITKLEEQGKSAQNVRDATTRIRVHILPILGDLIVSELTTEHLRPWLAAMAKAPAQNRTRDGKLQFRPAPVSDDQIRARRATANRVLTILKAALNHAYDEGHVASRDAWGRKLKPFRNVEVARVRYLTVAEAKRLINAADLEFRPLVHAALQTGARYGELAKLEVQDFNLDAGTVAIRHSKSGKMRHVTFTEEGVAFFRHHCTGHRGDELMFSHGGKAWGKSCQAQPMRDAVQRARITPSIGFHGLRHTWASLAVMKGVPLIVVARNLGHRDTKMVEHHYGHLAQSFVTDSIRAGAPRFGVKLDTKVTPLKSRAHPARHY
jgi:integrase